MQLYDKFPMCLILLKKFLSIDKIDLCMDCTILQGVEFVPTPDQDYTDFTKAIKEVGKRIHDKQVWLRN